MVLILFCFNMEDHYFREWFKRDYMKPIILIGENSYAKSAIVYTNFDIDTEIEHMSSVNNDILTKTYDVNKLYLVHDEVITTDYDIYYKFSQDISIHFIIIPSDYEPIKLSQDYKDKFILAKVPNIAPDKDWYWWCTELYKAGKLKTI